MATTALTYVRVIGADFVQCDDQRHTFENPHLTPPTLTGLRELWARPYGGIYVPVAYTFFAAEAWLAQREYQERTVYLPSVFHVGNLLLHVACVVLVFVVLRQLVGDDVASAFGALLYAVHPLQVESVAWVSETRGTLAGCFSLLSISVFLRFRTVVDGRTARPIKARRPWLLYALAAVAYGLALLSKPSAAAVPLMLVALDVIWLRQRLWKSLAALGWWLVPAMAIAWLTTRAQADDMHELVGSYGWTQRPLIAADAFGFYSVKLVAPFGLAIDYGRTPAVALASPWVYGAWAIPLALVAILAFLPDRRAWLTALALFVAGLMPVLGLTPFAFQSMSIVADRYVYLALLGPALAVAWLVHRFPAPSVRLAVGIGLVALAALSVRQTAYWQNSLELFHRALAVNQRSVLALGGLALTHLHLGKYDTGEEFLRRAMQINPRDGALYLTFGILCENTGRHMDAAAAYRQAIACDPKKTTAYIYLGKLHLGQGDWIAAAQVLQSAAELEPHSFEAHFFLAAALANRGQSNEAIHHWEEAVRIDPRHLETRLLVATALLDAGEVARAQEHCRAALASHPANRDILDLLRAVEQRARASP